MNGFLDSYVFNQIEGFWLAFCDLESIECALSPPKLSGKIIDEMQSTALHIPNELSALARSVFISRFFSTVMMSWKQKTLIRSWSYIVVCMRQAGVVPTL